MRQFHPLKLLPVFFSLFLLAGCATNPTVTRNFGLPVQGRVVVPRLEAQAYEVGFTNRVAPLPEDAATVTGNFWMALDREAEKRGFRLADASFQEPLRDEFVQLRETSRVVLGAAQAGDPKEARQYAVGPLGAVAQNLDADVLLLVFATLHKPSQGRAMADAFGFLLGIAAAAGGAPVNGPNPVGKNLVEGIAVDRAGRVLWCGTLEIALTEEVDLRKAETADSMVAKVFAAFDADALAGRGEAAK